MAEGAASGAAAGDDATVEPIGDAALLISFGGSGAAGLAGSAALAARARTVAAAIQATRATVPGIGRPVPAFASVLVPFDPLAVGLDDAIELARSALPAGDRPPPPGGELVADDGQPIEFPVSYGGSDGPDLAAVAELHGLRPADVIELHASATYRVLFLGFAPGFGYLGGLPPALATPRRANPRERVPAGSVGIAGEQTAVYPLAMPGGWQLIGRTTRVLFDPEWAEPALLRPGAAIRFVPLRR